MEDSGEKEVKLVYIYFLKTMKSSSISLVLLLLISSCKKKDTTEPRDDYDPNKPSFRIGTKWVYQFSAFDQAGILVNSSENIYEVIKDTTINGSKYYLESQGTYFSNKPDGHYFFEKNNNREILYFKYPASVGSTYNISPAGPFCAPYTGITVSNTDTIFTYNSRTYTKLSHYIFSYTHLSCQGTPSTSKYLFSAKIGLFVYLWSANNNSAEYSTVQLKSFTY